MKNSLYGEVKEFEFESLRKINGEGEKRLSILNKVNVIGGDTDVDFNKIDFGEDITAPENLDRAKHESQLAEKNEFKISPIVKKFRGLNLHQEQDRNRRIQEEVHKNVLKVEEDAFQKGYEEGVRLGKEEVFQATQKEVEEKLILLTDLIDDVLTVKEKLLTEERHGVFSILRNLTKWIILKELKDDGEYIERLLLKLVQELEGKKGMMVRVDRNSFASMPDVLETIQKKLGEISNIRVEIDYDIGGPGIILESESGIIDGTLRQQFESLDKLFKCTGVKETEDFDHSLVDRPDALTDDEVKNAINDFEDPVENTVDEEAIPDDIHALDKTILEGDASSENEENSEDSDVEKSPDDDNEEGDDD